MYFAGSNFRDSAEKPRKKPKLVPLRWRDLTILIFSHNLGSIGLWIICAKRQDVHEKEICVSMTLEAATPTFNVARVTIILAIAICFVPFYMISRPGSNCKMGQVHGIIMLLPTILGIIAACAYTGDAEMDRKRLSNFQNVDDGVIDIVELNYSWGYVLAWVGVVFAIAAFGVTLIGKREDEGHPPRSTNEETQLV